MLIVIISGGVSKSVENRFGDLNIKDVYLGVKDKTVVYNKYVKDKTAFLIMKHYKTNLKKFISEKTFEKEEIDFLSKLQQILKEQTD